MPAFGLSEQLELDRRLSAVRLRETGSDMAIAEPQPIGQPTRASRRLDGRAARVGDDGRSQEDRHHVHPDGLVFLVIGGIEALLMRWQLFYPRNDVARARRCSISCSRMHGTTMVFFMGMPILIGMGNYLVPLMIGARDMAFPRLNALGFWATLFGGLLVYFSFATGGAPAIGWFAYAPLTERTFARSAATDLWALGLIVSGIGTIAGGVNFIATILGMRAPGHDDAQGAVLRLDDALDSVQILLAIPPLTAALVMVLLDRQSRGPFLRRAERRLGLLVAAPVLVLRPSGGLHPDPAGLRHDLGSDSGLLAQGAVRLRVHGRRHDGHRVHQPGRLGASHVHGRA